MAQQQSIGPLHTPISDVAVIAMGYDSILGAATSVGEQPIKGLADTKSMAGLTVGEALTNLVLNIEKSHYFVCWLQDNCKPTNTYLQEKSNVGPFRALRRSSYRYC